MKRKELLLKVAERTGLPPHLVVHVLDAVEDEVESALLGHQEVYFKKFMVYTNWRRVTTRIGASPGEVKLRLALYIRPQPSFKRKLRNAKVRPH